MTDADQLAQFFQTQRPHLKAVAYRMLGSLAEADDAVQEAYLRLNRSDVAEVENLAGWLTTVTGRVCLDVLRARRNHGEEDLEGPAGVEAVEATERDAMADPELAAELSDSVGLALLVVMDTLSPAERLSFVLHDMFAVPFEEISPIVGKSPAAVRQLASRARRRVQGQGEASDADRGRQREVVSAFLKASRGGDFAGLLKLLDPDVVLRGDPTAVAFGATAEVRGAGGVAKQFSGRAQAAQLALIDGTPSLIWAVAGTPKVVFDFTIVNGRIAAIEMLANSSLLGELAVEIVARVGE
ncbi:RNA polymerase, sigma-24 subunit, ECF subfamily [Catenulispora acidiphila DSM 44928]|uniref:RNA polymerase, sigma-24 subunit, ECF subfamily n=1 Tax=Catenulispora acidiphila (strain DSM 44928 / JCM 14897 / NBRC 102108 / NRRL B-24433 / ID139908) TaxID=479433 RepID=C7QC53_CATAD|nr:sigma-70 family RNA polymerase sigma factor [Catenulispora acidiphila]ACU74501.1 RNA polymerase, sigma-24 subunit, ECF subfamily [Catenulispora acidiphila DSM 44928]